MLSKRPNVRLIFIMILISVIFITTSCRNNPIREAESISDQDFASDSEPSPSGFIPISDQLLNDLTPAQARIIINKGTELPYTGTYDAFYEEGTYYCAQCDAPLYASESKFASGCGWPAFDDEIPFAVTRIPDPDGMRTEIVCSTCGAHLGHVFEGEGFTEKDTRHCVNSLSLIFRGETPRATAVFAGGCFWGVEYYMESLDGVYDVISGYTGGTKDDPTYTEVLSHTTGHVEAVQVTYDPLVISYRDLAKFFFEIHDPTQINGQGPDIGEQYLSVIFYRNLTEMETVLELISILESKGFDVATQVRPAAVFWPAENYHQDYYERHGSLPYCHAYVERF